MSRRMTYDDLKYEQESQRALPGPFTDGDGHAPHDAITAGNTKGRCLHCEQPGHQWRACQWRCIHCGTFEHSYVPHSRAPTQCPLLLVKKPRIYDQHSYRHTIDRNNAVGRAEDVAELSQVLERFMQGLRRENEGLRNDLIRTQRYADLLERDLRETRERFWEERDNRVQVEDELRDEDAMREALQITSTASTGPVAAPAGPASMQSDRTRRLQIQRQRRSRRFQSDAQRRATERGGYPSRLV